MVLWKLSELSDVPTRKEDKSCDLSSMVAGGGLEPPTSGL